MKTIVGVMGPGEQASQEDLKNAYEIGKFCASKGWVTLTGGRNEGVMNEALKGAKEHGGLTLGILPSDDTSTFSEHLDIPVKTNMRSGRNYLNVLTSDVVAVCGMDHGTSSEVSLAIKPGKKIILVGSSKEANEHFMKLAPKQIVVVEDYLQATKELEHLVKA